MHTLATPLITRHRLSVEDYYRMAEAGILHEDDRVELIEGEIIDMAPIGSWHAGTVKRLASLFMLAVGKHAIVSIQDPVRLDRYSEPQPDIALLRRREDFYTHSHPGPEDVLLIVEVAQSSLAYDLQVKVPLYARHAIPEVWVLDAESGSVHICRSPGEGTYREVQIQTGPCVLSPLLLPQISLELPLLTP